ncbi:hypothetical protein A33Q_4677 [Indibacter alkaliphilus LW1]|uniref:Uncharacterized protein n=1 Tax=Indibacter alkaliphilus (strain CCUG 57479 / KCTC 22604 / LW1) TaxID=1189612 RepID=S2DN92_INDAL|nr:hypothetical protein A33Q_4677 [Indibacter alkaliphilus LW1]
MNIELRGFCKARVSEIDILHHINRSGKVLYDKKSTNFLGRFLKKSCLTFKT